jgi:hypothetical protein
MKIIKYIMLFIVVFSLSACAAGLNSLSENESGGDIESGDDTESGGTSTTYFSLSGQEFPTDGAANIVLDYNAIGLVLPDGMTIDGDSVSSETFILSDADSVSPIISPATSVVGRFDYSYEFDCETGPCTGLAFIPHENLEAGAEYTVRLVSGENGIRGTNGEVLEEDITWSFTTPDLYFIESYPNSKFNAGIELLDGKTLVTGFRQQIFEGDINPWLVSLESDGSTYAQNTDPFPAGIDGKIYTTVIHEGTLYVAGFFGTQPLGSNGGDLWVGAYNSETLERVTRTTVSDVLNENMRPTGIAISGTHLYVAGGGRFSGSYRGFIYEFNLADLSLTNTFTYNPLGLSNTFYNIISYDDSLFILGYGNLTEVNTESYILKMDYDFNVLSYHSDLTDGVGGKSYRSMQPHDGAIYTAGMNIDEDSNLYGLITKFNPSDLTVLQEQRVFNNVSDQYPWQGLYDLTITDDDIMYVTGSMWLSGTSGGDDMQSYGFVGKYTTDMEELDTNTFPHRRYVNSDVLYVIAERIMVDNIGNVQLFGFAQEYSSIDGGNIIMVGDPILHPFQIKLDRNLNIGGGMIDLD